MNKTPAQRKRGFNPVQTYISNNVGLADTNPKCLGRVDTSVHTSNKDEVVGRRGGEALVPEAAGVALRGGGDVLPEGRHGHGDCINNVGR